MITRSELNQTYFHSPPVPPPRTLRAADTTDLADFMRDMHESMGMLLPAIHELTLAHCSPSGKHVHAKSPYNPALDAALNDAITDETSRRRRRGAWTLLAVLVLVAALLIDRVFRPVM